VGSGSRPTQSMEPFWRSAVRNMSRKVMRAF
jgi:hypothetical protein